MKVNGMEVFHAMQLHRRMMERGEISMQEYSHMNSILFFMYMPVPAIN